MTKSTSNGLAILVWYLLLFANSQLQMQKKKYGHPQWFGILDLTIT